MMGSWIRAVVGIVVFGVVLAIGLVVTGSIDADQDASGCPSAATG